MILIHKKLAVLPSIKPLSQFLLAHLSTYVIMTSLKNIVKTIFLQPKIILLLENISWLNDNIRVALNYKIFFKMFDVFRC